MSPYGVLNISIQRLLQARPHTLNDLIRTAKQAGLTPADARRVVERLSFAGEVTSQQLGSEILVSWIGGEV